MKDIRIGIIGCGFVGSSVKEGLSDQYTAQVYDKYNRDKSTVKTLEDLVLASNIIFICLPTPMKPTGECDIKVVQNTVKEIDNISAARNYSKKILVIKSTVPPNTTKTLQEGTSAYCDVIFNPEFLTEANHIEDFKNQNRIILGGDNCTHSLQTVKSMYMAKFPTVPYIICGSLEAELTKYFSNCFLATKVSFANEMKQLCESLGADYNRVVESSIYDKRIGNSHLSVPGPDGRRGFGGSCFPKDVNAMIYTFEKNDVKPSLLKAVWEKNLEVRPEKDWEKLKGRAVTDD